MRLVSVLLALAVGGTSALAQAPSKVVIPPGYAMTAVATGLNFPTALTFVGDSIWVTEAGFITPPAVKMIDYKGNVTTMLTDSMLPAGVLVAPVTCITFAPGYIWLVHEQTSSERRRAGRRYFEIQAQRPGGNLSDGDQWPAVFRRSPGSSIAFGADGRGYLTTGLSALGEGVAQPGATSNDTAIVRWPGHVPAGLVTISALTTAVGPISGEGAGVTRAAYWTFDCWSVLTRSGA